MSLNDKGPLISIGIPTYNRPEGLRLTLERIIGQTYENLEIIISDNCSPGRDTHGIVLEYMKIDTRIKYYRQDKNIGASANFQFVSDKATGEYFMWAADDDYFEHNDLVEKLLSACTDNILAFPDFNFISGNNNVNYKALFNIFGLCKTDYDYIIALCQYGYGHPIYGLYNLNKFRENGLLFEFDNDLEYYNEGTFLHKLFLKGKVKFVPEVCINYDYAGGSRPHIFIQLKSYTAYAGRVILIHIKSTMNLRQKITLLRAFLTSCSIYQFNILKKIWKTKDRKDRFLLLCYSIANPLVIFLLSYFILRYVTVRVLGMVKKIISLPIKKLV